MSTETKRSWTPEDKKGANYNWSVNNMQFRLIPHVYDDGKNSNSIWSPILPSSCPYTHAHTHTHIEALKQDVLKIDQAIENLYFFHRITQKTWNKFRTTITFVYWSETWMDWSQFSYSPNAKSCFTALRNSLHKEYNLPVISFLIYLQPTQDGNC